MTNVMFKTKKTDEKLHLFIIFMLEMLMNSRFSYSSIPNRIDGEY